MPFIPQKIILVGLIAFICSMGLTFLVRSLARRLGYIAKPKADRWHKKPTAMMGGVSVFFTTVALSLLFVERTDKFLLVLAASSFLFLVGLLDDLINIKPYQKLVGQLIGVAIIVSNGLVLQWTDFSIINLCITALWLVGITNAINLLDNMDGLATGISVIAALSLSLGFIFTGQFSELAFLSVFIGALLGFLVFNFNPASIFMGDCGSMFIGFFLAGSVLLNQTGGRSRGIMSILAVPALILFVPIFDTTFVTILRKLWGRKASQGGRDHTSHRLVALGLSEKSAVLMLWGFAILAGAISFLVRELSTTQSLAMIGVFGVILVIMGVYLAKVKVYEEQDEELALQNNAAFGFLLNLSYKRRIFEVILDAFLISLAYYSAYVLLFGPFENSPNWDLFFKTLPILIVLKLFAFLAVGVYRGIWRYTSIQDLFTFSKGVALGTILSLLAILVFYRFTFFSRAVFIVDAILLFMALAGSRMAFRLFRQIIPVPSSNEGRKALIYGAGDGGEMVLRELNNNPEWSYNPIGFIDDDPLKNGKVIHGLKVYEGNGSLEAVLAQTDVQEILISSRKISHKRIKEIRAACIEANVSIKRALLKIEPIDFE